MNKEGWAPAVYLKRVGFATGNSPASLKRLTAMGMQLRDETKDVEEMLDTEGQGGGSSRKSTLDHVSSLNPPLPPLITTYFSVMRVITCQRFFVNF